MGTIEAENSAVAERSDQPAKLLNKNFVLLWQGQFISQIGTQVHGIAIMFWLKHATGSATIMGTLMMASMLPGVLLGPIGGAFADRHSRRKIILYSDLFSGILVLIVTLMLFYRPGDVDFIVVWLTITYIFMGITNAAFGPALSAALPDLVPREKIPAANSLRQSTMQISSFFGQGLGGVLFRLLGAPILFLADAVSFFISAISLIFVKIPQKYPERVAGFRAIFDHFKKSIIEGLHYVWKHKGLRSLIFSAAFLNFFIAPVGILLPFYVEDTLKSTPDWFGYFMALLGAGALLGYAIAGWLYIPGKKRSLLIVSLLIIESLTIGALGLVRSTYIALIIFFFIGLFNGTINIYISTILQVTTPTEIRGRVFSVLGTVAGGLAPIAMGLAGVIADLLNKNIPLIFILCGGISAALAILVSLGHEFREFLAHEIPRAARAK
ncbi:Major facilitator superfamily MFS_1 [Candidatus Zixiibacteriota bacterium]|nr:Major facilitator superfamily MFS_1 [candidate division Zixibacteria bacterium]